MPSNWPRVIDLTEGMAMVVTDLHGDWDAYQRYRDRFLTHFNQGTADFLIITGDFIHYYGRPEQDQSLRMVLDLLVLRQELGERLIYLLGNHEIPHIYGFPLQKGDQLFTPRFEHDLGENRNTVLSLFHSLPFIVRTRAGVSICHAGASDAVQSREDWGKLRDFSHNALIDRAHRILTEGQRRAVCEAMEGLYRMEFSEIAHRYFAVEYADDPWIDHILAGHLVVTSDPEFNFLWQLFFSRNELESGIEAFEKTVLLFLASVSADFHEQRLLVSGHIDCVGGFTCVTPRHLRIASAKNAHPRESGRYLLFDTGKKAASIEGLTSSLGSVWT